MVPTIDKFYAHPNVFSREFEDLVLFCYSRECQYDNIWDEVTLAARGIIFNKVTGELISLPFKKFFNAGEVLGKIDLNELAKKPFRAMKKMDGSFAIVYKHKNEYHVATKGSFISDQAAWATKWLREHVKVYDMQDDYTYLFEMIYPENRIVVDYGDREELVLLGVMDKTTGMEISYEAMKIEADRIGVTLVEVVEFKSLDDLYAYCKTLPSSEEGFVVTFHNGYKIKVKGDEYCKIHRILANMTPLAFWGAWDLERANIPKEFLVGIPEEFREVSDMLYQQIYDLHIDSFNRVKNTYEELMKTLPVDADHKTVFLTAQERYGKMAGELIYYHKKSLGKLLLGIHRRVRPSFNVMPDSVAGSDRLKRIMQES